MKPSAPSSGEVSLPDSKGETSKLLSLLALAGGAVAMPQTTNADLVFVDLSATNIIVGANSMGAYVLDLPGTNNFNFQAHTITNGVTSSRFVIAGGYPGGIALKTYGPGPKDRIVVPAAKSLLWGQIAGIPYQSGTVGAANTFFHVPDSYANKYIAFTFRDSTAGNAIRYGWIEVSLSNPANNNGPDVQIFGYAYDDSGIQIQTGIIPEPSAVGLSVLGALTLGAAGLRNWRRKRDEV